MYNIRHNHANVNVMKMFVENSFTYLHVYGVPKNHHFAYISAAPKYYCKKVRNVRHTSV